jgi:hypothetical protein
MGIFDMHVRNGQLYLTGAQIAIFGTTAVAFTALCLWLTMRIYNRRERWAKRTLAAVIGAPVLYVLRIGPAAWITHALGEPQWAGAIYMRLYGPINLFYQFGPKIFGKVLDWYTGLL